MSKATRKKSEMKILSKRIQQTRKTTKGQTKAAECVQHLLELHKVQGVLLIQLSKEV